MSDITWMQVLALMIGSGGITSGAVAITMKLIDPKLDHKTDAGSAVIRGVIRQNRKTARSGFRNSGAAERIRRVLESLQGPRLEWGHGCENS